MGGRIKCRVRGLGSKRLPRYLKSCLMKVIRKVVRTRSLPHTLRLVVKNRRSTAPRPRQVNMSNGFALACLRPLQYETTRAFPSAFGIAPAASLHGSMTALSP